MSDLFSSPLLWVEQPTRLPVAKARYKVLDGGGTVVAKAAEQGVSLKRAAARAVFGDAKRRLVEVRGPSDEALLVIEAYSESNAFVMWPNGARIGSFEAARRERYHSRAIIDHAGHQAGLLRAGKVGRRYEVTDAYGAVAAQIDKKWTGVVKEMVTSADRYRVEIHRPLPDPLRLLVPVAAIALDMIFFENKDWGLDGWPAG
ncbi:phospholipid scramblase-related protein [Thermomonospora amylolytica]|uniref:phospholipid scramblase-related protein n=1 Tax=Thermomonospora amylolytica TaxID=1411117 RepID=UPI000E6C9982|nr:phospholipid scramblase-related protein [Thermomonospora amylolytica]